MNRVIQIFVAAPPDQVDEMFASRPRALFTKYELEPTARMAGVWKQMLVLWIWLVLLLCCSSGVSAWQESSQSACA